MNTPTEVPTTKTIYIRRKTHTHEGMGPGFSDQEVTDGYEVRETPFPGAVEAWTCAGCNREYGANDRGPRVTLNEPALKISRDYCDLCVEDRKHLADIQPDGRINLGLILEGNGVITECPQCGRYLSDADRLLINCEAVESCADCESVAPNLIDPRELLTETIWGARWNQRWLECLMAFVAIVGIFAAVMAWRIG